METPSPSRNNQHPTNEDNVQEVLVPGFFSDEIKIERNSGRQLLLLPRKVKINFSTVPPSIVKDDEAVVKVLFGGKKPKTEEVVLWVRRDIPKDSASIMLDSSDICWVGKLPPLTPEIVRESWRDSLSFKLGDRDKGLEGLRLPQLGAVHAVLGYWTTDPAQPATVVMPTGTGKTETMIALLASERPERLLVVVPSDVLRNQTAHKFESFGVLQEAGVIFPQALRPIVGQLKHAFSSSELACQFAVRCNVLVTTPQALFASAPDITEALLGKFSHLFVDEAHHVEAATWRRIRDAFEGKPVLQFTATPFREDGRRIAGRIVYSFPLREAQRHNYFSRINYLSVTNLENPDQAIALAAIEHLRSDLAKGYNHVLMARVRRIGRASELQALYVKLAPDLAPVILHSSLPVHVRQASLEAIRTRRSRVIVCVDMLGEGFDMPSLKVAAIHDLHKSLGVTLQFVGRFARVADPTIGEATVITSRPEGLFDESLRRLYSEEPDWNLIIRDLSETAVGEQHQISEFESEFSDLPEEISPRIIKPKMSTVIYRTQCENWNPQSIYGIYPDGAFFTDPIAVNEQSHVAWFVLESRSPVSWGELETVADTSYDLFILYWDETKQLLYINSSDTESLHESLAKAVCSETVSRITGENIYRVMANVKRLVPTNVGLLDIRNRSRRFSMYVGADVTEGFPTAEAQTKTQTNIFAYGFENGSRVSIGGSLKGRIWSYRVAQSIKHWVDWCDQIGSKVNDETINIDQVMKGFIRPTVVESRPPFVAISLEWPWEVIANVSDETRLLKDGHDWELIDIDLKISEFSETDPIRFEVSTPSWRTIYEIEFSKNSICYRPIAEEPQVLIRQNREPLSEYLNRHGLNILFEKDTMVVPEGLLLKPNRELPGFDPAKLVSIDWMGVNIRKESQGPNRDADSIQARAVEYIRQLTEWDVIIDDDGPGEMADIVAIRANGDRLLVELAHCKFSSEEEPGGRVDDLYEVCGQAQKSVRWRRNTDLFFQKLIHRERNRAKRHNQSGFIVGDINALYRLKERSRQFLVDFGVYIIQPGLLIDAASPQQLELLGSTEVYLQEVGCAPLCVLCSG